MRAAPCAHQLGGIFSRYVPTENPHKHTSLKLTPRYQWQGQIRVLSQLDLMRVSSHQIMYLLPTYDLQMLHMFPKIGLQIEDIVGKSTG